MKVLVTGGNGFLGRYIVEQLLKQGDEVSVFCRSKAPKLNHLNIKLIRGDVCDREAVLAATKGLDIIYHAASKVGFWGKYEEYYQVNVLGTINILESARINGVKKIIYTSSPSVAMDNKDIVGGDESLPYSKSYLNHYSSTKAMAEQLLLNANGVGGVSTTAIRPHLIIGPRDPHLLPGLLDRAQKGRLKQIGKGENMVGVTYVENAANAHLQAARSDNVWGKVYFINEKNPVNLWKWIRKITTELTFDFPKHYYVPYPLVYMAAWLLEKIHQPFPFLGEPLVTRFLAGELSKSHHFSIAKAEKDFDYKPLVPFKDAMEILIDDLKELYCED